MTAAEIVGRLESLAGDSYKRILLNHGATEPVLGVKIEELKKFQKQLKKNHCLALDLFETGIYDAQYLAGLIADETRMTRRDLKRWLANANCAAIGRFVVAPITAESRFGQELALEWIASKKELTAQTGWSTLTAWLSITDDADVDAAEVERLLAQVERTIHQQPNLVRYAMNYFVIAVGTYVPSLTSAAVRAGEAIGRVTVDMGNTSCKVPFAPDYIEKVQKRGTIGKKRKTARC